MKALKLFIISTVIIGLTSCSKDSPSASGGPAIPASQPATYMAINFTDSSGTTHNSYGKYYIASTNSTTTIQANGQALVYNGTGFDLTTPQSVGGNTSWWVNINQTNGFTYTTEKAVPYIYPVVFNQIDTGSNYTITLPRYITADNIVYTISNGVKTYTNTASISSTGTTFSAAQIDTLFTMPYMHNQKATIEIIATNSVSHAPQVSYFLFVSKNTFHNGNVSVTP